MRLTRLLRLVSVLGVVSGIVHVVLPDRLLAAASWGYDRLLAVEFDPRANATRRVRLFGILTLLVGLAARSVRRRIVRWQRAAVGDLE
ncbi:MAG: hypothetical protein ABEI99_10380 [Halobaculum sp.]